MKWPFVSRVLLDRSKDVNKVLLETIDGLTKAANHAKRVAIVRDRQVAVLKEQLSDAQLDGLTDAAQRLTLEKDLRKILNNAGVGTLHHDKGERIYRFQFRITEQEAHLSRWSPGSKPYVAEILGERVRDAILQSKFPPE